MEISKIYKWMKERPGYWHCGWMPACSGTTDV